jgi:hypothetical protein
VDLALATSLSEEKRPQTEAQKKKAINKTALQVMASKAAGLAPPLQEMLQWGHPWPSSYMGVLGGFGGVSLLRLLAARCMLTYLLTYLLACLLAGWLAGLLACLLSRCFSGLFLSLFDFFGW